MVDLVCMSLQVGVTAGTGSTVGGEVYMATGAGTTTATKLVLGSDATLTTSSGSASSFLVQASSGTSKVVWVPAVRW
jgi:hypothetical protein